MFKCQMCNKVTPPKIKSELVITKRRKKNYPFRQGVNRAASWKDDKTERLFSSNDNGGSGYEADEVKRVCPQCAAAARENNQVSASNSNT